MKNNFFDIYEKLIEYRDLDDTTKEKIYLNIFKNLKKCMFCGKDENTVKFKKVAHAISEGIGNKRLISHNECDECNKRFGDKFEDDFCKYIQPFRITSQIFGKKSYIKHKDDKSGHRIEIQKSKPIIPEFNIDLKMLIQDEKNKEFVKIDKDSGEMTIAIKRQKYIPINVYKALMKMAISIMPKEEIVNFAYSVAVLMVDEDSRIPTIGFLEFISGINPFKGISVRLFKRKENAEEVFPYMIFLLSFGNFSIQIPIWSNTEFKSEFSKIKKYIKYKSSVESDISEINFNIFDKVEDQFKITFKGKVIELDINDKTKLENELKNEGYLNK